LKALDGTTPEGVADPWFVSFVVDKYAERSSVASEAVAAATAMNAYMPKSTSDTEPEKPQETSGWQPRSFTLDALASDAGKDDKEEAATAAESSFVFDAESGYYYDSASGYYYDANSQLYYHPSTQAWYRHNQETGEYDIIPAGCDGAVGASPAAENGCTGCTSAAHAASATTAAQSQVSSQVRNFRIDHPGVCTCQ
jgi:hypothetical protein